LIVDTQTAEKFETWAVVEIMGHVRVAGRVTEQSLFGTVLLRVDIPSGEGFMTRYFGGSSIYSLSPCTEGVARAVAAHTQAEPVYRYELPQLQAAAQSRAVSTAHEDQVDADIDEFDEDEEVEGPEPGEYF
jgi:hypothetical protein